MDGGDTGVGSGCGVSSHDSCGLRRHTGGMKHGRSKVELRLVANMREGGSVARMLVELGPRRKTNTEEVEENRG